MKFIFNFEDNDHLSTLREDIREIYLNFKDKCEPLNDFIIEDQTDLPRESYVYEWYTGDNKIFYVGKGVKNRINHILSEELKKDSSDGIYNHLKDNFGIYSRKVLTNLTDLEASLYEVYWIWKREQEGEVLLQSVDANSYWGDYDLFREKVLESNEPLVYLMPIHERYYAYKISDFKFEQPDINLITGIYLRFRDLKLKKEVSNLLRKRGLNVYQKDCKSVNTVIFDDVVTSIEYLKYKKHGYNLYHYKQIEYFNLLPIIYENENNLATDLNYDLHFIDKFELPSFGSSFEECYNELTELEKNTFDQLVIEETEKLRNVSFYRDGKTMSYLGTDELYKHIFIWHDIPEIKIKFAKFMGDVSNLVYDYASLALKYYTIKDYENAEKFYCLSLKCCVQFELPTYSFILVKMISLFDKLGKYNDIVEICKFAIKNGVEDNLTAGGYEGRLLKYKKKNNCI